jgi:class 3 adenylate cyclase
VTFVLSDIVGSTAMWEAAPTAMELAITRYEEIVSTVVTAAGGIVLKARGEGDSTFSVFSRASDGVSGAYEIQRAISAEPWPADAVVRLRISVHSGEAVEREGDYYGPAVNLAARLRGVAQGGQIVMSTSAASVARRHLPRGCELVELGSLTLPGIATPEQAWVLSGPGLAPLAALCPSPRVPPVPHVSRREAEVHALVAEHLANADIAARLYISERTVESHVSSLLRKHGVNDRRALARLPVGGQSVAALETSSTLALPPIVGLHADGSTFVGRDREGALLDRQWALALSGHTLLVVVSGEAGIGKSRLIAEFASNVHAAGARVLFGACYEDVEEPYGPFIEAIERAQSGPGTEVDPELGRLFPQLAPSPSRRPERAVSDSGDQGDVFGAVERWLLAGTALAPTLLILEDLHWATASTLDLLRHLMRRAGHHPLLVVATTRDTEPDASPRLTELLGAMERLPASTRLALGGLEPVAVAALLGVGADEAEEATIETGGVPLLLTHARATGSGESLSTLLARRDELLSEDDRALLDLAATLGAEFDADLLASGHGTSLLLALDSLERAERAGWVVPRSDRPGRFRFVHALFRSHRHGQLSVRQRLECHARASAALATRTGDTHSVSERARHACLAVPLVDVADAVALAREAAALAEWSVAYDEAANHYRRALDAVSRCASPDSDAGVELTADLAIARHHASDPAGLSMLLDAAARARQAGHQAAFMRVAASFGRFGFTGAWQGPIPEQLELIEEALDLVGPEPSAMRVRLLVALTGQLHETGEAESLRRITEAEAMARELGDNDALMHVLLTARMVLRRPGRKQVAAELERLGTRSGSIVARLAAISTRASIELNDGDLDAWDESALQFRQLLGDRPLTYFQLEDAARRTTRAILDGDLALAEQLARATVPLAVEFENNPTKWSGASLAVIRRAQGRDAGQARAVAAVAPAGVLTVARFILPAALARTGGVEDARDQLATLRSEGYAMPNGFTWPWAMSELAEAGEVADDADAAAHAHSRFAPKAGELALVAGGWIIRPVDQALAQAALAMGDPALAQRHALAAVSASRRRRTPLFLARELVFLAEARRRTGASRSDIRPLVDEALEIADRLGARIVAVDAERYGLG